MQEHEAIKYFNFFRIHQGLEPLQWCEGCCKKATIEANTSETCESQDTLQFIGTGAPSIRKAVESWVKDKTTTTILSDKYKYVGVGVGSGGKLVAHFC